MKSLKFLCVSFLCIFANQFAWGDILIRKDPDLPTQPNQPNIVTSLSSSLLKTKSVSTSLSIVSIPVTADIINSELIVDFTSIVGTATVSVVDANGYVVYQTNVDTFTTSEVAIPLDGLSSGKYSLKISYGTTKLTGNFQL